jgi:hypothetical protein
MQPIDQARVSKLIDLYKLSPIKAVQLLYGWTKTKVINFETFYAAQEAIVVEVLVEAKRQEREEER